MISWICWAPVWTGGGLSRGLDVSKVISGGLKSYLHTNGAHSSPRTALHPSSRLFPARGVSLRCHIGSWNHCKRISAERGPQRSSAQSTMSQLAAVAAPAAAFRPLAQQQRTRSSSRRSVAVQCTAQDPLLLRVARGEGAACRRPSSVRVLCRGFAYLYAALCHAISLYRGWHDDYPRTNLKLPACPPARGVPLAPATANPACSPTPAHPNPC